MKHALDLSDGKPCPFADLIKRSGIKIPGCKNISYLGAER
jgi:hypothetical protein